VPDNPDSNHIDKIIFEKDKELKESKSLLTLTANSVKELLLYYA